MADAARQSVLELKPVLREPVTARELMLERVPAWQPLAARERAMAPAPPPGSASRPTARARP